MLLPQPPQWQIGDIAESSVTQHEAALTILESQITDGSLLARVGDTETITAIWAFNGGTSGASAPFTVDSTFLVTNLNADLLDGQTGSYYLNSDNFTGTEWTDLTDGGGTTLHTHALNNITNPTGNKTFVMTTRTLKFLWTNPGGNAMEFESSGAYSGSVLHIHQHTGNPGANTYLITLESEDTDVHQVVSIGPVTTTEVYCTDVSGDTEHRFFIRSDGQEEWGPGNVAQDTNFYRDSAGVLKTDGAITATTFTGALVGNASTATALASPRTIGGVSFDGTANIVPTTIAVTDTADATCFVGLWESATGDLLPQTDLSITYNASTGVLTATGFSGPLTGTASLATLASTVTVIDSTDATSFIAMFDSATGSLAVKTDGALLYNATNSTLTATTFSGATCFVGLWESATGDLLPQTDLGITYNASTGVLTATGFAGPLTGTASLATLASIHRF